jgi:enoyl-CoA hydratase/carnithine racemase
MTHSANTNPVNNLPELKPPVIQVEIPREGVALISISSEPLGVLRFEVKRTIQVTLAKLETDPKIHCVVLTGTGRAFSVGSDIRDFRQDVGWLLENEFVEAGLNAAIENSRLPVIAVCNGFTLGGGAVLALACDIRLAAESAQFGFPEVKVAAFASGSGTQRLPRLVGRGRALDLLLTGRSIDAAEALSIGLVEYVYPDDELIERALDLAAQIAANASTAVSASKRCVNVGLSEGLQAGLAMERQLRVETGTGPDAAEGRAAFLEKRQPRFTE